MIAFGALAELAAAADCPGFTNGFDIFHWEGPPPASVAIHVLHGAPGAKFESEPPLAYHVKVERSLHDRVGAVLVLTPEQPAPPELQASNDYRIVIDEKIEFLVQNIVMTDRANLGCPIASVTINSCKRSPGKFMNMESSCGRPLH